MGNDINLNKYYLPKSRSKNTLSHSMNSHDMFGLRLKQWLLKPLASEKEIIQIYPIKNKKDWSSNRKSASNILIENIKMSNKN